MSLPPPPTKTAPAIATPAPKPVPPTGVKLPPPAAKPAQVPTSTKTFQIKQRSSDDYGKKIAIYGPPGSGKSTLASYADGAVFIDLNKGLTGLNVQVIEGVENFSDLREAIHQSLKLVPERGTLVIDSATETDAVITEHLKVTHKKASIKELSYDRFSSAVEAFRLVLSDLDAVIATRRSVILLAHESSVNYKNALGADYRVVSPKLTHASNDSCRDELVSWCDHVFRLALADAQVDVQTDRNGKVVGGKVAGASTMRYLTTDGTQSMIAKSRPIDVNGVKLRMPPVIQIGDQNDRSLWDGLKNPAIYTQENA